DYLDFSNMSTIGNHRLTIGLQYESIDRNSEVYNSTYKKRKSKNYGHFTPYFEPSGVQSIYAIYISDEYNPTSNVVITPSIRYEYINSEGKGNAASDYNNIDAGHDYSKTIHAGVSGRLSIDYSITESTSLNLSYANVMKAPTIDDIFSVQYARATATATARDLKPSRINAYQTTLINKI
ncbi:TonB-dependent receptor domain-containing protein, partial [Vibrio mediterranei]|uniref:TonB-dependent receptor domain-containing protein n=1 Tax=Vibrio mediterranei TaxID=689 RepID=UPI001EFD8AF8